MNRSEAQPVISLVGADNSDGLMRRALAFHIHRGWSLKSAETVPSAAVPATFGLKESIPAATMAINFNEAPGDRLALRLLLEPTRALARAGAHARSLQIGMSSVACSFEEHPVEIWLIKESAARSMASFQAIVEEIQPSWATLIESTFRGPSVAEARSKDLPGPISLQKLFISDSLFTEASDRGRLDELGAVQWNGGVFVSGEDSVLRRVCWPIFRRWAFARERTPPARG